MNNKKTKSWSINATPYRYPRILGRKTKTHYDVKTRQRKKFKGIKISAPRAGEYMGYNPKRGLRKGGVRPKISYAEEYPSS